jgi:putative ribosome biogenesis GTPase RsgA
MPVFPAPDLPHRERAAVLTTVPTPASAVSGPVPPNEGRRSQLRLRRLGWSDEWDARYRMATATGRSPTTPVDRVADGHLTQSIQESGGTRHRGSPDGIRAGAAAGVGRVARIDATGCACLTAAGPIRAAVTGGLTPVAGDWVRLDGDRLVEILPRSTAVRRGSGRSDVHGEVVAANADLVLIVQAFPLVDATARTERLLGLARASGAQPVLVLSQVDRAAEPDELAAAMARLAVHAQPLGSCPGVDVLALSTAPGHLTGVDRLRERVQAAPAARTAVLVGPPGSGKSALVDALSGTRSVPSTTGSILVPLPGGGAVVDTLPGTPERSADWLTERYATRLRCEQRARWRAATAPGLRRVRPAAENA